MIEFVFVVRPLRTRLTTLGQATSGDAKRLSEGAGPSRITILGRRLSDEALLGQAGVSFQVNPAIFSGFLIQAGKIYFSKVAFRIGSSSPFSCIS